MNDNTVRPAGPGEGERLMVRGIGHFLGRVRRLEIHIYAAYAAYFWILAIFPAVMLVISILQYTTISPGALRDLLDRLVPASLQALTDYMIDELFAVESPAVLSISAVMALWMTAKGVLSLIHGLNRIYTARETRSPIRLRLRCVLFALCGVLANVFSANGRILTFLFGLIDVTIYGVMCLTSARYGNAAMHLLYFLPMQFIGFFQWRKRGAGEGERVRARRLAGRGWLLYGAVFFVGLVVAYVVLAALDKTEAAAAVRWLVLLDAFSMMCNILGQWLMSTAYMEQWIFWIGVNIASVAMWVLTLRQSPDSSYAAIYVVKYAFYLLNSLNGLRIWLALSRPDPTGKGSGQCLEI